jgi:hypothetical protein
MFLNYIFLIVFYYSIIFHILIIPRYHLNNCEMNFNEDLWVVVTNLQESK